MKVAQALVSPTLPVGRLVALGAAPASDPTSEQVDAFLGQQFGLSRRELDRLDGGRAVVRSLDTVDGREVAIGVIRFPVPAAVFAERSRNTEAVEQGTSVLQADGFGSPPEPHDVEPLELEPGFLQELRDCGVGGCDVHVTYRAIEALGRVRWEGPPQTRRPPTSSTGCSSRRCARTASTVTRD